MTPAKIPAHPSPASPAPGIHLPRPACAVPEDIARSGNGAAIGKPGEFPYTRGVHAEMYRKRLWTMRQFAGFGTPEDTNRRFKYLLEHGQTGLSTAFDLPTLMGRDSDDPMALGEVGKCGVAVSSLDDMRRLFDGINLGEVSTSMTINCPAAVLLAFYICVAEDQGVPLNRLRGTLQNDILKEFHAQNEYLFPPEPSVRLVVDTIEYGARQMPLWNTVSISGYHIREAGATAVEELAFTIADGICYVEKGLARGLAVDDFAPRLSFFWDIHCDFFEEIAKLRAARRIWAQVMKEKFAAKDERSLLLRCHSQTAGVSLTRQQPFNNVVRVTCQALAAVLGGTQSLHTNSMDETMALPSEEAAKIALRTQQVLAYETRVAESVDPLGGSWLVETMTNTMEAEARRILGEIDRLGGVIAAIDNGYFRRRIAESALREARAVERADKIIVGVNRFTEPDTPCDIPILHVGPGVEREQVARLKDLRARRDAPAWRTALERLADAARAGENVMPRLVTAARASATVGEMMTTLKNVYGTYGGGPEF
ncbi:MAG: methylmalonyl-CoA mutase family protein [Planctomycetota bacterium]